MKQIIYNGKILPENCVPGCKVTLCDEKATIDCERCGTPICNGHLSAAVGEYACQWCRLIEWARLNGLKVR